jgi:hypothetical protein
MNALTSKADEPAPDLEKNFSALEESLKPQFKEQQDQARAQAVIDQESILQQGIISQRPSS